MNHVDASGTPLSELLKVLPKLVVKALLHAVLYRHVILPKKTGMAHLCVTRITGTRVYLYFRPEGFPEFLAVPAVHMHGSTSHQLVLEAATPLEATKYIEEACLLANELRAPYEG